VYLNLVLDFVPETVYRVIRHHSKAKQIMPVLYIKVSRGEYQVYQDLHRWYLCHSHLILNSNGIDVYSVIVD